MKRHNAITLMALTLAFAACLGFWGTALAQLQANRTDATLAFEKLKTLMGHWEATTETGKASATYQVVAGGSALLERLQVAGEQEMITVYYLDGNRLLLTHYCEAGNQPRMQAASFDPKTNQIDFRFLDATNLPSPDAGHMHQVLIAFRGPSEVAEEWTFYKGGKSAFTVPLVYHRVD